ncbi:hypothetical protein CMZ84_14140 [Lysobacteraceae bacterium NML93-0399]|nr:hypothetical protein CMZ84_14140 [Xanthomonadaceae bacterium NML93-0399]
MQKVLTRHARTPTLGRFGWLMALYAENHDRLVRMFDPAVLAPGRYRSAVAGTLPVLLDVVAQHRYTTELRLSYAMLDPVTGEPDPSAHLRLYRDAGQVEATHCYVGRRWQDVIGMFPPPVEVVDHRLRMNTFLGKWLQYLDDQGHGLASLLTNPDDARLDCSEAGANG